MADFAAFDIHPLISSLDFGVLDTPFDLGLDNSDLSETTSNLSFLSASAAASIASSSTSTSAAAVVVFAPTYTTTIDGLLAPLDYYHQRTPSETSLSGASYAGDTEASRDWASDIDFRFCWLPLHHPQRERPRPPAHRRPRSLPIRPVPSSTWKQRAAAAAAISNRNLGGKMTAEQYDTAPVTLTLDDLQDQSSLMAMLEGLSGDVDLAPLTFDAQTNNAATFGSQPGAVSAATAELNEPDYDIGNGTSLLYDDSSILLRSSQLVSTAMLFQGEPMDEEDIQRTRQRQRQILRQVADSERRAKWTREFGTQQDTGAAASDNKLTGTTRTNDGHTQLDELRSLLAKAMGSGSGGDGGGVSSVQLVDDEADTAVRQKIIISNADPTEPAATHPQQPGAFMPDALQAALGSLVASIGTDGQAHDRGSGASLDVPHSPARHSSSTTDSTSSAQRRSVAANSNNIYANSDPAAGGSSDELPLDELNDDSRALLAALEATGQDPEKAARQMLLFQLIQTNLRKTKDPQQQQQARRIIMRAINKDAISAPRYIAGSAQVEVQALRHPMISSIPGSPGSGSISRQTPPTPGSSSSGMLAAPTPGTVGRKNSQTNGDSIKRQLMTIGKKFKNSMSKRPGPLEPRTDQSVTPQQHQEFIVRQQQLHEEMSSRMKQEAKRINMAYLPRTSSLEVASARPTTGRHLEPNDPRQTRTLSIHSNASSQRSGRSGSGSIGGRYATNNASFESFHSAPSAEQLAGELSTLQKYRQLQQQQEHNNYLQQQLLEVQKQRELEGDELEDEQQLQLPVGDSNQSVDTFAQPPAKTTDQAPPPPLPMPGAARISTSSVSALLPPDLATANFFSRNCTGVNLHRDKQPDSRSTTLSMGPGTDSLVAQIAAALEPLHAAQRGEQSSASLSPASTVADSAMPPLTPLTAAVSAATTARSNTTTRHASPSVVQPPSSSTSLGNAPTVSSAATATLPTADVNRVDPNRLGSPSPSVQLSMPFSTFTNTSRTAKTRVVSKPLRGTRAPVVAAVWSTTANAGPAPPMNLNGQAARPLSMRPLAPTAPSIDKSSVVSLPASSINHDQLSQTDTAVNKATTSSVVRANTIAVVPASKCSDNQASKCTTALPVPTIAVVEQRRGSNASVTAESTAAKSEEQPTGIATVEPAELSSDVNTATTASTSTPPALTLNLTSPIQAPLLSQPLPSPNYDDAVSFSEDMDDDSFYRNVSDEEADDAHRQYRRDLASKRSSVASGHHTLLRDRRRASRHGGSGIHRRSSRSRSRTRHGGSGGSGGSSSKGRLTHSRKQSRQESLVSAVRLRKHDSAMSVWSIDLPDPSPMPAAPPPAMPPLSPTSGSTTQDASMGGLMSPGLSTSTPGMRTSILAKRASATPSLMITDEMTADEKEAAKVKAAAENSKATVAELVMAYENISSEWEPRPKLPPLSRMSMIQQSTASAQDPSATTSTDDTVDYRIAHSAAHASPSQMIDATIRRLDEMLEKEEKLAEADADAEPSTGMDSFYDLWMHSGIGEDAVQHEVQTHEHDAEAHTDLTVHEDFSMMSFSAYGLDDATEHTTEPVSEVPLASAPSTASATGQASESLAVLKQHTTLEVYPDPSTTSASAHPEADNDGASIQREPTPVLVGDETLDLFGIMAEMVTRPAEERTNAPDAAVANTASDTAPTDEDKDDGRQTRRRKTNAANTAAKLDDLMNELICI